MAGGKLTLFLLTELNLLDLQSASPASSQLCKTCRSIAFAHSFLSLHHKPVKLEELRYHSLSLYKISSVDSDNKTKIRPPENRFWA